MFQRTLLFSYFFNAFHYIQQLKIKKWDKNLKFFIKFLFWHFIKYKIKGWYIFKRICITLKLYIFFFSKSNLFANCVDAYGQVFLGGGDKECNLCFCVIGTALVLCVLCVLYNLFLLCNSIDRIFMFVIKLLIYLIIIQKKWG